MLLPHQKIFRLIRRLQQINRFVGRAEHTGLSPAETHFLIELHASPERSISELAELLGIDQSFGSRISQALSKRKLIRSEASSSDARRKILSLTLSGEGLIRTIDDVANHRYRELAKGISSHDLNRLVILFGKLGDEYDQPPGIRRGTEPPFRVEQRRVTRGFGLLGERVFGSRLTSSQWQLLAEVVLGIVPPQPTELARLLTLAQNSLSAVAVGLEKERLIVRRSRSSDKRSVTLHPLQMGIDLYNEIEAEAVVRFRRALKDETKDSLDHAIGVLERYVGGCLSIAPSLPPEFRCEQITVHSERQKARGFVLRELVQAGYEDDLPDRFIAPESHIFTLNQNGQVVALLEVSQALNKLKTSTIVMGGWRSDVSPWVMMGFVGEVHRRVVLDDELNVSFINFPVLNRYLGEPFTNSNRVCKSR